MKKLLFTKISKDTIYLFLLLCLSLGLIVWTIQAVNYLDYVTQDGHGLKTYFLYSILNFPKIIHRIIPFIFFISLFYIITNYEIRNELLIFWTSGITKINFANKVIFLSLILIFLQICIGSFFSPMSQYKAREYLQNSNIDFFTSLINTSPAETKHSLFAKQIVAPRRTAASDGFKPAAPTIEAITKSVGCSAASITASVSLFDRIYAGT